MFTKSDLTKARKAVFFITTSVDVKTNAILRLNEKLGDLRSYKNTIKAIAAVHNI